MVNKKKTNKQEQTHSYYSLWIRDDGVGVHLTHPGLRGQNDVQLPALIFVFTFLVRQRILHHQQKAIKASLA